MDRIKIGSFYIDQNQFKNQADGKPQIAIDQNDIQEFADRYAPLLGAVKDTLDYCFLTGDQKALVLWLTAIKELLTGIREYQKQVIEKIKEKGEKEHEWI